jgi:hypothetical protein
MSSNEEPALWSLGSGGIIFSWRVAVVSLYCGISSQFLPVLSGGMSFSLERAY